MQELKRQGYTIIQIKKHLGLSYSRVAGFFHAEEYPAIKRAKGRSRLDEFDAYLYERWASGCQSAGQLYREMCGKGYTGSDVTVRRHVQLWREKDVKILLPAPKKISVPGPRSCVWLLLKRGEKLTEEACLARQTVLDACPAIAQGLELIEAFRKAICSHSEKRFDAWMDSVTTSRIPEFENFVKVLQKDGAAVRAAVISGGVTAKLKGRSIV